MGRILVYCAASLDGYIAGEADDLGWLNAAKGEGDPDPGTLDFADFMAATGAMLMGRRTFDVVMGFGGEWPYGTTPVLVATNRPLGEAPASVNAASGDIEKLCGEARRLAGAGNVYVDGGGLISAALDAGLVDEMILTIVPVLLGKGILLYRGEERHHFAAEQL